MKAEGCRCLTSKGQACLANKDRFKLSAVRRNRKEGVSMKPTF